VQAIPGNGVRAFSEVPICAKRAQATEKKEIAGEQVLLRDRDRVQVFKERRSIAKKDAAGHDPVASARKNYYNKCVKLTKFKP
jgi:hypothetical protein